MSYIYAIDIKCYLFGRGKYYKNGVPSPWQENLFNIVSDNETHEYRMFLLQNLIVGQETSLIILFAWDTFKTKSYEKKWKYFDTPNFQQDRTY